MSRTKRFIAGTIASYGSLAANIVFTLVSVPLALAYLDKEHFGLWALATQLNGYLILLELGMGNAINRHIADHKDNVNGGIYGSYLITSGLVYLLQGVIIAAIGFCFSWFAPALFSIPLHLASDFQILVALLAALSGISIASRSIGSPLWGFQRLDVINHCFTLTNLSFLGFLWLGFQNQLGIFSFPLAQLPAMLLMPVIYYRICKKNGYYPSRGKWGKPRYAIFQEIFRYGRDMFMMQVGNQFVHASQIIIISRFIGLGAAATYAIGTKVFTMAQTLFSSPISTANPILTELYVRNEQQKLRSRFKDILAMSLAIATVVSTGIALSNRSFIEIWTSGGIEWVWHYDLLLAVILIVRSYTVIVHNLFAISKELVSIRYTYFIEGMLFIILSSILAKPFGITGILMVSLLSHFFCTAYWFHRASLKLIGKSCPDLKKISLMVATLGVAATFNYVASIKGINAYHVMAANIPVIACALVIVWRFLLGDGLKDEIINGAKKSFSQLFNFRIL